MIRTPATLRARLIDVSVEPDPKTTHILGPVEPARSKRCKRPCSHFVWWPGRKFLGCGEILGWLFGCGCVLHWCEATMWGPNNLALKIKGIFTRFRLQGAWPRRNATFGRSCGVWSDALFDYFKIRDVHAVLDPIVWLPRKKRIFLTPCILPTCMGLPNAPLVGRSAHVERLCRSACDKYLVSLLW
jgi:hypothetical protein